VGFETVQTVEANGITTAYSESGAGEPLLILNAGAGETFEYPRFVPHLPDGIRFVSFDQRGFGVTVAADEPYTFETLADDAIALADALGLARAHYIGFAYGGMLALQVAVRHPERVHSLIVGNAAYSHTGLTSQIRTGLSPEESARRLLDVSLSSKGQADPEVVAELKQSAERRRAMGGSAARRIEATAAFDMAGRGKDISAPTLLIYGEDDPLTPPKIGQQLNREIPDSELMIVESGRHSFLREFPAQVGQRVGEWVLSRPVGFSG
jgi:pimeloyl-ACP methyl ester carboxylesterase